jgi:hypothetical protein
MGLAGGRPAGVPAARDPGDRLTFLRDIKVFFFLEILVSLHVQRTTSSIDNNLSHSLSLSHVTSQSLSWDAHSVTVLIIFVITNSNQKRY